MKENESNLINLYRNKEVLDLLLKHKDFLVPFIGAGFSTPSCPTWAQFLDLFFERLKGNFLLPADEAFYLTLKNSKEINRFEKMADFLIEKSAIREFGDAIKEYMEKPIQPTMKQKFNLLLNAFPGLKITTNYDCLIENHRPPGEYSYIAPYTGFNARELNDSFTNFKQNSLLKIHGDYRHIHSIVLASEKYIKLYGDPTGFNRNSPLPNFLERVFLNSSVLFIGCSLAYDRTTKILMELSETRPHFAIMRRPSDLAKLTELNTRLSNLHVYPLWITHFDQIEEILQWIAPEANNHLVPSVFDHGIHFIGRENELGVIKAFLDNKNGTSNAMSSKGGFVVIDGAGGMGKTMLAVEAAIRLRNEFANQNLQFPDGIWPPIQMDQHTPKSLSLYLARLFHMQVKPPKNNKDSHELISSILKERRAFLIFDHVVKNKDLAYMFPFKTSSVIIVTTRCRTLFNYLKDKCGNQFFYYQIPLGSFSTSDAMEFFHQVPNWDKILDFDKICLEVSSKLDFMPLLLRLAQDRIVFPPRYTLYTLRDKLLEDDFSPVLNMGHADSVGDSPQIDSFYETASRCLSPAQQELLKYMAACSPGPIPIDFLARLVENPQVVEKVEELYDLSWCECEDINGVRSYRLLAIVREWIRERWSNPWKDKFICLVDHIFITERPAVEIMDRLFSQLEEAIKLAVRSRDARLIRWLYLREYCIISGFSNSYLRLTRAVEQVFAGETLILKDVYAHRALVHKSIGQLKEALELFQKEEKLCLQLSDFDGLAKCYGNQSAIYQGYGNLTQALELCQKEENAIKTLYVDRLSNSMINQASLLVESGNLSKAKDILEKAYTLIAESSDKKILANYYETRAILFKGEGQLQNALMLYKDAQCIWEEIEDWTKLGHCYLNQAVIHNEWGELENTLALLKDAENMYEKSNDIVGQSMCFNERALVMVKLEKLQEALELYKKEEALLIKIGNPLRLARYYGNQAIIKGDWEEWDAALELHKKEEKIRRELNDRIGLIYCYGNQAALLIELSSLDEALKYCLLEEKLSEETGYRNRLPDNWWNQGIIYGEKKDKLKKKEFWEKSIALNKEMNCPTKDDEQKLRDFLNGIDEYGLN